MRPLAMAMRCVADLAATSTMWALPAASKWVSGEEEERVDMVKNRWSNRLLIGMLAAVMAVVSVSSVAQNALPNLGDGTDLTPAAERKIGDRIARQLYRDPDYVDDPIVGEYVQGIWQPLLTAARERGELPPELDEAYAWEILLGRDHAVNAFALPGAYFGLNLGLVGIVSSRDELASVLAHELSHVTQRHIARSMMKDDQQSPLIIGAMILALLAAARDPNSANGMNAANAAIVGGQALGIQNQLNFSRDMEREADRVGFSISTQAGFAPQGFVTMFDKLQQSSRLNDSGNFPYLRTHPLSTERMADMEARIDTTTPPAANARKNTPETDHSMMAARARVLSNSAVDALRNWNPELQGKTPATLYGSALAAIKLREFTQAEKHWKALTALVQNDAAASRLARLLGVEIFIARGGRDDRAQALKLLGVPKGRAELLLWAQAAVQSGTPLAPVSQALQSWVTEHPHDAGAWMQLANLYTEQGRTLASIRAQAESLVAQQDPAGAFARFKAGQEWIRNAGANVDHFEASIIDTRARQLEAVVREEGLNLRAQN